MTQTHRDSPLDLSYL